MSILCSIYGVLWLHNGASSCSKTRDPSLLHCWEPSSFPIENSSESIAMTSTLDSQLCTWAFHVVLLFASCSCESSVVNPITTDWPIALISSWHPWQQLNISNNNTVEKSLVFLLTMSSKFNMHPVRHWRKVRKKLWWIVKGQIDMFIDKISTNKKIKRN